ncbi:MAG: hypothetical protein MJ193_04230 [Clostridia bacterium]|nr:hypothetical protein [Clostridia bacterium]
MKIWAKIYNGDRLEKNIIYESELTENPKNYIKDLQEICYRLDISTPVSLPSHYKHFIKFNRIKYLPRDFIEEVDFTSFVMELVIEKK